MEVPLPVRGVRRSGVYCDLSGVSFASGNSDSGLRIFYRTGKRKECGRQFREAGALGDPLALDEMDRHCGLLPADDVLHHGGRLDALLLLAQHPGRLCSGIYRNGNRRL